MHDLSLEGVAQCKHAKSYSVKVTKRVMYVADAVSVETHKTSLEKCIEKFMEWSFYFSPQSQHTLCSQKADRLKR